MHNEHNQEIKITTRDRLMRAWENSMELTRDFEVYSKEINDRAIQKMFADFAVEEGLHASKLRDTLMNHHSAIM